MRLIDADALKFGLEKVTLYVQGLRFGKTVLGKILEAYRRAVYEEIENATTIDPEELRPKGGWKIEYDGKYRVCSRCNICIPRTKEEVPDEYWQYCPNCGAYLRGDGHD